MPGAPMATRSAAPTTPASSRTRTALVGAGTVAEAHLAALRQLAGVEVAALCDPDLEKARRLAGRFGVPRVCGGVEELLAEGGVDAVHVLAPPDHHAGLARRLLEGGIHLLVEKPLALSAAEAEELGRLAEERRLRLGTNHQMLFHPCVARLFRGVQQGRLGTVEHVAVVHHVPLRQLQAGPADHFALRSQAAVLFEQAVHPFSLVRALAGCCRSLWAAADTPRPLPDGRPFRDTWWVEAACEKGTAQLFLAFGREMEETTLHVVGSDGAARVDLARGTLQWLRKTAAPDFWDRAQNAFSAAAAFAARGWGEAAGFGADLLLRRPPRSPHLAAMAAGIGGFHAWVRGGGAYACDALHARDVLAFCEQAAAAAGVTLEPSALPAARRPGAPRPGEVLVTGAAGFLGRHLVERLRAHGVPVTVLVRRAEHLPEHLRERGLRVFAGDARDPEALAAAARGAAAAVHLATAGGEDPGTMVEAMAEAARAVGEACLEAGVRRLVFASSTSALYLGGRRTMAGTCGTDPLPLRRSAYARGKIAAEEALARLAREKGLEVVVVRPAIVVGPGGRPEHGGVGTWVRGVHCIGWSSGRRALPFVLARDVAAALHAATTAPAAAGRAYNLAGAVPLSARDYVGTLARATGRPYRFHPRPVLVGFLREVAVWVLKGLGGRTAAFPSLRDLRSRAFLAPLDTTDARADLGFAPETDRERFLAEALPPARDARGG